MLWCVVVVMPSMAMHQEEPRTPPKKIKTEHLFNFSSPQTITYMVPEPENQPYVSQAWTETIKSSYAQGSHPGKNSLFFCTPQFTHSSLIDELNEASKHGVDVRVLVGVQTFGYLKKDTTYEDQLKKFSKLVRVFKIKDETKMCLNELHAKLFLYSVEGKVGYSIGSSNMSWKGLFHNNEINQITTSDPENYKELLEDVEQVWNKSKTYNDYIEKKGDVPFLTSPIKRGRERLEETPQKKHTVVTTVKYDIEGVLMSRLDPEKFEKDDVVWLSTYTYNNQAITDVLESLLKKKVKIYMYIDTDPFTHSVNWSQLNRLFDAGATIYKYEGQYLNHAKFLLIERREHKTRPRKVISIISTQNIMKDNRDFDALSINVSEKVFDTYRAIAQSYEKTPFRLLEEFPDLEKKPKKKKEVLKRATEDQPSKNKKKKQ